MSDHHTHELICKLCNDKLRDAHPDLAAWFGRIKEKFPDAHLSWTYRDEANQELFFKMGRTRAHYPHSAHNKQPSRAMDLFQLRPDNVAAWPKEWFRAIAQMLTEMEAPIVWGGIWASLGDGDHYQLKDEPNER